MLKSSYPVNHLLSTPGHHLNVSIGVMQYPVRRLGSREALLAESILCPRKKPLTITHYSCK
ncbi:hypothetical protein EPYR_03944 [Erwinia pyrifoliae DSM 12163]|nr:hypothetical protein EPYR_03944 [Erwinia pyrifoliae DSM 12163]